MKLNPTIEEEEGSAADVVSSFLKEQRGVDYGDEVVLDLDDHEGSTLVGAETSYIKEKEIDVDITDSEDNADDEDLAGEGCGVKRRRTIRVIIRSRAFL